MPEIALPPPAGELFELRSLFVTRLCARAMVAGDHPLLQRITSGASHAEEISAWAQSRWCLAEYLAKKEILVLAKAGDREARRLWTTRLLAIDGHGDFYGPCKQGLIEAWRRLVTQLQPSEFLASQSSLELTTTLERLFDEHLRFMASASWIESLGASIVDDWVVRHDWMAAVMLSASGTLAAISHGNWNPFKHEESSLNTMLALGTQFGPCEDRDFSGQICRSLEKRVELEHAILTAVQVFGSSR